MEIIIKKSSFFIIIVYIRRAPRPGKSIDSITLIYYFFHTTASLTYYSTLQEYKPILQRLYLLRYIIVYQYFTNLITLTLPYYLLFILLYSSVYQLYLSPRFLQLYYKGTQQYIIRFSRLNSFSLNINTTPLLRTIAAYITLLYISFNKIVLF